MVDMMPSRDLESRVERLSSATSRASPVKAVPIWLVTYAYPTPTSGSAKPRDPPEPGEPNERSLPKRQFSHGFMKPSENCTSPFKHSS